MSEDLQLNITIDTKGSEAVGIIRKNLKEANGELVKAQALYGEYSAQAIAAAKKVAQFRDQIQEARETADLFDPGKRFQAFTGTLTTIAGGISAVQGAFGLLGAESKDLEKALLKVNSAMALSQGLSTIVDGAKDFQRLGTIIKVNVVSAFNALKGAIGATGIGLLVIAIAALIDNFDKLKKIVTNAFPALNNLSKIFGDILNKVTDFVGITSEAGRALEALEKSTKIRNEALERQVKLLTAQGGKEKEVAEINKQVAQNEINVLKTKVDKKGILYGEDAKKYKDLQNQIAIIDATENKRVADKAKADKEKKDAEKKAAIEKAKADRKEALQAVADAEKEFALSTMNEEDKELRKVNDKYKKLLNEAAKYNQDTSILEEAQQAELAAIRKKYADTEKERSAASAKETEDFDTQLQQRLIELEDEKQKKFKEYKEAEKAAEKDLYEQKWNLAYASLNILTALAGDNERLSNVMFIVEKAMSIARIVKDTQQEIAGYYANPLWSAMPDGGLAIKTKMSLGAKIRAGVGIATIAATTIQKYKGGGSAGAAVPNVSSSAPIAPMIPTAQTTNISRESINDLGNQAIRAYVVEKDVTSSQQRVTAIRQRASFS